MANTVTVTKILEGKKEAYFHVYLLSDGAAGELSDQVLIDPAVDFSPALTAGTRITLMEMWGHLVGFDARLEFDATADTTAWVLNSQCFDHIDFSPFGGISDRSGAGATGKLQITTSGFTAATDQGTLIIRVRKNQ